MSSDNVMPEREEKNGPGTMQLSRQVPQASGKYPLSFFICLLFDSKKKEGFFVLHSS